MLYIINISLFIALTKSLEFYQIHTSLVSSSDDHVLSWMVSTSCAPSWASENLTQRKLILLLRAKLQMEKNFAAKRPDSHITYDMKTSILFCEQIFYPNISLGR